MVEWGTYISGIGKEGPLAEDYDAPKSELVEIYQLFYMDYLTNETDVMNRTIQSLKDQGQTPIFCAAWKDLAGMHVLYQYRSSGFPWVAIAAVIVVALAVFGIYLLTQVAYRIMELPGGNWILLLIAGGFAVGSIAVLYYLWVRRDT